MNTPINDQLPTGFCDSADLSLPELRALGLDTFLSDTDLLHAINQMSEDELRRFVGACGLDATGDRDAVSSRLIGLYARGETPMPAPTHFRAYRTEREVAVLVEVTDQGSPPSNLPFGITRADRPFSDDFRWHTVDADAVYPTLLDAVRALGRVQVYRWPTCNPQGERIDHDTILGLPRGIVRTHDLLFTALDEGRANGYTEEQVARQMGHGIDVAQARQMVALHRALLAYEHRQIEVVETRAADQPAEVNVEKLVVVVRAYDTHHAAGETHYEVSIRVERHGDEYDLSTTAVHHVRPGRHNTVDRFRCWRFIPPGVLDAADAAVRARQQEVA